MTFETCAVHCGTDVDPTSGAIVKPVTMSVAFERDADGGYHRGYFYSSKGNPNRNGLESAMAALEGGSDAVVFASGCSAISAVLRTLNPGDHVLIPNDVFQGTVRILAEILTRFGLLYTVVEMTDLNAVHRAFQKNTKLVWMETLSNPLLKVTDLKLLSDFAHHEGALTVVDNSFVTPVFQRPLSDGVDLVVHSTTKYIGGHGDVIGGVVVAKESGPLLDEVRRFQQIEGAVPSPFDCWMVHRGVKTLAYRMRGHTENAFKIAKALEFHPQVEAVHYPGLESHPQHGLAKRQLSGGFGGIVSIQVRGGRETAVAICAAVKIFKNATSFGAVDSLLQHQASSPTHGTDTGLADNLLRLSIGLEHPDDLIDDLQQAFSVASGDKHERL